MSAHIQSLPSNSALSSPRRSSGRCRPLGVKSSTAPRDAADSLRAQLVFTAVAMEFGLADAQLISARKGTSEQSFVRQISMYLCHVVFEINLSRVARAFQRDRSTVSYACHMIEDSREDPLLDEKIADLEQFLDLAPRPMVEIYDG